MKKIIVLCFFILFASQLKANDNIDELNGFTLFDNSKIESELVYFSKYGEEDKLCDKAYDNERSYCFEDEQFKAKDFEKGKINTFQPIEKSSYNYIEIIFSKNRKAYLKIEKDIDIQNIYGDKYPIMKYSQYKSMNDFVPTTLVKNSKIKLVKKTYLSKVLNFNDDKKTLYYIDKDGREFTEDDVGLYRNIYKNHIKKAEIIDLLTNFDVDFDKENLKTNIYSKNSFNNPISPRIMLDKKNLIFILDVNHYQNLKKSWIFPKGIKIEVDDKQINISDLKFKKISDFNFITHERASRIIKENEFYVLKEIIKSKKSNVIYEGRNYNYSQKHLNINVKKEILDILKIYYLIKREI